MFLKKISISMLLMLISVFAATSDAATKINTATGTFIWKDQTYRIKHVYVTKTEAPSDETKKDAFLLMFTDAPVGEDVSKLNRFKMIRLLEKKDLHGIVVGIDSNGGVFLTEIPHGFSGSGISDFEPGQMKPDLIEGRIHTNGMRKFFDSPYQFDISFKAAVQSP